MYCLITGSSRGLGKALAYGLCASGHTVAIHYKDKKENAFEAARLLHGAPVFQADLRKKSNIESMINAVKTRWGRLDVLINNAAVTHEALCIRTKEDVFDSTIAINLTAPALLSRSVIPLMSEKGGHIITISSLSGLKGQQGLCAYGASKAGLVGLSLSLARELACYNIRVNTVLPGYIMTDMGQTASPQARQLALNESLLGRFSDVKEVSGFINYLIQTKGITGQIFNLDSRIR